ncbi:MAG TPA: hypothetical protein VG939_05380 [Caulobacteraceae bacterium]|nr:hypothetical protein [Caulobacteraceae bacterium]
MSDDKDRRIAELEAQLAAAKGQPQGNAPPPPPPPLPPKPANKGMPAPVIVLGVVIMVVVAAAMCGRSPGTSPAAVTTGGNVDASTFKPGAPLSSSVTAAPGTPWDISVTDDDMGRGKTRLACLESEDQVYLSFPYPDAQHAKLCIRQSPKYGWDVYVQLDDNGQFSCALRCSASVKFGDGKPARFAASEPDDGSTGTLFLSRAQAFLAAAKAGKRIKVEAEYYQHGVQTLTFRGTKLEWPK